MQNAVAPQQADAENTGADGGAEETEFAAHGIELTLQGGLRGVGLTHHGLNPAQFGLLPRGHHQAQTTAAGHHGPHIGHIGSVREGGIDRQGGFAGFEHRQTFPGQRRFIHHQLVGLDQTQISRDMIPWGEPHDVAGHQGGHRHGLTPATAHHGRVLGPGLLQGVDGALGLLFGNMADAAVEGHDAHDHHGVRQTAGEYGNHCRTGQQGDGQAFELTQQNPES